jgi:hypothetical protein
MHQPKSVSLLAEPAGHFTTPRHHTALLVPRMHWVVAESSICGWLDTLKLETLVSFLLELNLLSFSILCFLQKKCLSWGVYGIHQSLNYYFHFEKFLTRAQYMYWMKF